MSAHRISQPMPRECVLETVCNADEELAAYLSRHDGVSCVVRHVFPPEVFGLDGQRI